MMALKQTANGKQQHTGVFGREEEEVSVSVSSKANV
jgi:hypothetical protein